MGINRKMKKLLIIVFLIFTGLTVLASDLIIESKTQTFSDSEKKIKLDGGVKVKLDNLTVISPRADVSVRRNNKLDTATFYDKPYAFEITTNKKREVKANILQVSLINKIVRAEGDSQSIITEGNTPIVIINANEQEYDTKSNIMVATGAVSIKYKDIDTLSDKAVIIADTKGGVKKIDLIGNAKVTQNRNVSEGHHFVYNPVTDEMNVSGNTKTTAYTDDGKKLVIHSDYQQYSKKQNSYIGNGHVRIWFDDYYAQGPKVTVFPDENNQKLNQIYFVGRSKIVQTNRDIIADKIMITMNPKDFKAEGNVRTIIHNIDTKDINGDL